MTHDDLNQYIFHYLTKDRTQSAIMLTGGWGTGKSHYILNQLIPFLAKEENGKHKCIVVSLYGMKDTLDISRSIYMECRVKFLKGASEGSTTSVFVGKSIIKGVTSFFGIDLSKSEGEMRELYESIDLSGKLIILEDLERSGIDILEVLGYVNNLVEQDGVKVLLVANEEEIIQKEPKTKINEKKKEETYYVYTEQTEQYLRSKEKTVSDTIQFEEDFSQAIQEIIRSFGNETLDRFATPEIAKDILWIMQSCESCNLRSFLYGCQKAADIFNSLQSTYIEHNDFIQAVYYGVLFYVFRVKIGQELSWGNETLYSNELGHKRFPLFKFCYDYITKQVLDTRNIQLTYDAFKEMLTFDDTKSNSDPDINTLYSYHIHSEEEIKAALHSIETRLRENPDDISFYMYGTIAVYSVIIKELLNCNIDEIKRLLVCNLQGKGKNLRIESIFRTVMGSDASESVRQEYKNLYTEMAKSLQNDQNLIPNFDYRPEQSGDFYKYVVANDAQFHGKEGFARFLDIERLAEMFLNSSQEQKNDIRGAFLAVYRIGNIKMFLPNDIENLTKLLSIIQEQRTGDVGDRIQQLQYDYFIGNLTDAINKLK